MKSFLFSTDNERGGVILCNLDTLEEAVEYLQQRFDGVVRVEEGRSYWTKESGFDELPPADDSSEQGGTGSATP